MNAPPRPLWVCLKAGEKLVARFDPKRCILEVADRREIHIFDLAELIQKYSDDPPKKESIERLERQ